MVSVPGKGQPAAQSGRLTSAAVAAAKAPYPGGLRPLVGGSLLLVPAGAVATKLLVYFHGAGGRAADGVPLFGPIAADNGLLVLLASSRGRSWDLVQGGLGPDVSALDLALQDIRQRYRPLAVAFAGFSDGASYALTLGLANGDLVEEVIAFSPGFVRALPSIAKPRVWVSHGVEDSVLPVEVCGRAVVAQLRDRAYDVQYVEFAGGHVVTPDLLTAALTHWSRQH